TYLHKLRFFLGDRVACGKTLCSLFSFQGASCFLPRCRFRDNFYILSHPVTIVQAEISSLALSYRPAVSLSRPEEQYIMLVHPTQAPH
ncbi:hypothetical protein MO973_00215, partial [Paenibacillus sp. TRM 82003]|nr:hypothetical protein [Paenibacillus sp. TRM 82003]